MKPDEQIMEPAVIKAMAHPLRVRILAILDQRTASPSELAEELEAPLGNVSYHVRTLAGLGLITLVGSKPRRGAIEHYYRAEKRPVISDRTWAEVPTIVKHAMVQANLGTTAEYVRQAAADGGFDRDDAHLSRTTARLDAEGWREMVAALSEAFERVRAICREAGERVSADPHGDHIEATAVLMLFEGGEPSEPARDGGRGRRRTTRSRAAAAAAS